MVDNLPVRRRQTSSSKAKFIESKFSKPDEKLYQSVQDANYAVGNDKADKLFTAININLRSGSEIYRQLRDNYHSYKSVTFVCDTLTVEAEVKLPGIHVNIYTRQLTFEQGSKIDISAGELPAPTPAKDVLVTGVKGNDGTVKRKAPVQDGLSGGNFRIFCQSLKLPTGSANYLISNGGVGQQLRVGKDGAKGKPIEKTFDNLKQIVDYVREKRIKDTDGDVLKSGKKDFLKKMISEIDDDDYEDFCNDLERYDIAHYEFKIDLSKDTVIYEDATFHIHVEAGDGKDAIGDSQPSNGGCSGSLTTNQSKLKKYFTNTPGQGRTTQQRNGGHSGLNGYYKGSRHSLKSGESLKAGEELISPNGRFRLAMQKDGNLVIYKAGKATWASGTGGKGATSLDMQRDGNLVIYKNSKAMWSSKTNGKGGIRVDMQDDGNLVIFKDDGDSVWASDTWTKYYKFKFILDESKSAWQVVRGKRTVATKGTDWTRLTPPKAGYTFKSESGKEGEKGEIKVEEHLSSEWLHPALAETMTQYAKDLYQTGNLKDVKTIVEPYAEFLQALEPVLLLEDGSTVATIISSSQNDRWQKNHYLPFSSVLFEMKDMHDKSSRDLDYYGNMKGYMPAISLAAAAEFYKNKISNNIPVAIVSDAIWKKNKHISNKAGVLSKMIEATNAEMKEAAKVIKKQSAKRDELLVELYGAELKQPFSYDVVADMDSIEDLDKKLKAIEAAGEGVERKIQLILRVMEKRGNELYEKADAEEERLNNYKKALKMGATACRVIPVYQPALGTIGGTALDGTAAYLDHSHGKEVNWEKALNFDRAVQYYKYHKAQKKLDGAFQKTQKRLSEGNTRMANIYNDYTNEFVDKDGGTFDQEPDKWLGEKLKELDGIQKNRDKQKKDLKSDLVRDGLKDAKAIYKGWAVNKQEVEKAYQKLSEADEMLKQISKRLEVINEEKAALVLQLDEISKKTNQAFLTILNGQQNLRTFADARSVMSQKFDGALSKLLLLKKQEAFKELYYYHYMFTKAYEAFHLESYEKDLNTETFFDALNKQLDILQGKKDTISVFDDILKKSELIEQFYDTSIIKPKNMSSYASRSTKSDNFDLENEIINQLNKGIRTNDVGKDIDVVINFTEIGDLKPVFRGQYNTRFAGLSLNKKSTTTGTLSYVIKDEKGVIYDINAQNKEVKEDERGKFKYTFDGIHRIEAFMGGIGEVRKSRYKSYLLRPETEISYYWSYDFRKGKLSLDDNTTFSEDKTYQSFVKNNANGFSKEDIIALPPLKSSLLLRYMTNGSVKMIKKYTDGQKVEIDVIPQIDEFSFQLIYTSTIHS